MVWEIRPERVRRQVRDGTLLWDVCQLLILPSHPVVPVPLASAPPYV